MDNTTLLIVVIVLILLLGGGGWYGRGRWFPNPFDRGRRRKRKSVNGLRSLAFQLAIGKGILTSATQLDLEASTLTLAHRR